MDADQERHLQHLRSLFRDEAREHFDAIRRELAAARDDDDPAEALKRALRAAHSVKGGATISGFPEVGDLIHNFESSLGCVAKGEVALDDAALDLLLRTIDAASDAVALGRGLPGEGTLLQAVVSELDARFGDMCTLRPVALATASEPEAASKEGVDDAGTVRISTQKLDRQLAGVEELLRLKVGQEDRLTALARCLVALDELRTSLSESRTAARDVARKSGESSDSARVASRFDTVCKRADDVISSFASLAMDWRRGTHALSALADTLHGDVRAARMLPVDSLGSACERIVRDAARATGKKVHVDLVGGGTEVDRDVLEAVKDPLVHLLRNAVDHGVETADDRRALRKPESARIRIQASSGAGVLELEISDDGRGVSAGLVGRAAVARGIVTQDHLDHLDVEQVRALVFHEGFSTAREVTSLSGRGVGLSVVRSAVERIGGRVTMSTTEGAGTRFRLVLPLNLATSRFLLVEAAGQAFAIPALGVERVLRVQAKELVRVDHGMAFRSGGQAIPIHGLSEVLGIGAGRADDGGQLVAVVLSSGGDRAAFVVDRALDERELVARGLGDHLRDVNGVAGAAVLPDGSLAPILSAPDLLRATRGVAASSFEQRPVAPVRASARILVVDDSVTTRTLEKGILESVGHHVEVATDGMEALERLSHGKFSLVLSDVQMPRMDGLSLVRAIRSNAQLRELPVVLVSSLDSSEHRTQGLDAGADAYLSKGEFEQGLLLSTIQRFI